LIAADRLDAPAVNHGRLPFTENKRYPAKPRRVDDVVNPKDGSVYQTDVVLILVGALKGAENGRAAAAKQYRVRRCPKDYLLRSL
jgi:hypothetical protein